MLYDIVTLFRILNAPFAAFESVIKTISIIVVIIIIIVVVLTTQKSKPKNTRGGKMFCQRCGEPISESSEVCVKCGAIIKSMGKFCFKCGEEIPPSALYCSRCGYAVNQIGNAQRPQQKSKIAAGLFGIFLGGLGVHNFYLGFTGKAIAQLLISLLSFGLLAWVSAIWGLIEGIMILAGSICYDKNGVPLKD